MTYVFDVFTEPRRGNVLTGSVTYRDPDNYGFSQGPVFGLQLIMSGWEELCDFGFARPGAVSAATEAEFKELFELDSGPWVRVDEEGYLLEESSTQVRIPRVKAEEFYQGQLHPERGRRFSNGTHYIQLTPQPDEFARRATEIIVSWNIREDDSTEVKDGEGSSADFTLEVSDPRYLEHFAQSEYFQTVFTGLLPS
ncbi:hypothetical protein ACIRQP_39650 [Streptomyces sp. NPDC102274]|uniref:hypothetical protein n=1 Tax=Streptomyces sp. NPDC102274 TaxID=3366151 RepID=UPI00380279CA